MPGKIVLEKHGYKSIYESYSVLSVLEEYVYKWRPIKKLMVQFSSYFAYWVLTSKRL